MGDFEGEFWIVAVATEGKSKDTVYATQRTKLQRYCSVFPFDMPKLRVSAVDELLNLNDTLTKYDNFGRQVLQRLVRSYREFMEQENAMPQVRDRHVYRYIPTFKWEKGRFSLQSKLPALVDDIHERLGTTHDRLKTMVDKYKKVKQRIVADERANEGNLMVCDLQKYVKPADYIDGEYITTAMVVVPTGNKSTQFEQTYWKLEQTEEAAKLFQREANAKAKAAGEDPKSIEMDEVDRKKLEFVAPDSCQLLEKQKDFSLYRVVLLKKGLKWFTDVCREFRYNVRDFEYRDAKIQAADEEEMKKLTKEESDKKKRLVMFCTHAFPDAMEQWLHIKMIRCFVEAILRYGPNEEDGSSKFATSILKVNASAGGTLSNVLSNMYKHLQSKDMEGGDDDGGMAMMGLGDLRPYIFVPVMSNFD
jgi:V-type H+-transporting ATPase subunit C